jgi:hypothetical protein
MALGQKVSNVHINTGIFNVLASWQKKGCSISHLLQFDIILHRKRTSLQNIFGVSIKQKENNQVIIV